MTKQNVLKKLISFMNHCDETGQAQVAVLQSEAIGKIKELESKITELEKGSAEYLPTLAWIAGECIQVDGTMLDRLKGYLAIRDLEQQAKGVEDFEKWVLATDTNASGLDVRDIDLASLYSQGLSNQAKALKEQG